MATEKMSFLDELTNIKERSLFQESCGLFEEILDGLNAKGLLRKTMIKMDVDRLAKIWENSRLFGLSFNKMVDKFKPPEVAESAKKSKEEQFALGYSFYSQLVGTALYYFEAVLKTSFVFVLEEYTDKNNKVRIRKKMTLGELLFDLKQMFPIEGKKLDDLLDVNLRNSIAHGTFWFEGDRVFLAQNSHLDEVEQLSLSQFWIRLRRINIISHAFIEILLKKAEKGYFKL